MCKSLPNDYRDQVDKLLVDYQPIEENTQMSVDQKLLFAEDFWTKGANLIKGVRFQYKEMVKVAKKAHSIKFK